MFIPIPCPDLPTNNHLLPEAGVSFPSLTLVEVRHLTNSQNSSIQSHLLGKPDNSELNNQAGRYDETFSDYEHQTPPTHIAQGQGLTINWKTTLPSPYTPTKIGRGEGVSGHAGSMSVDRYSGHLRGGMQTRSMSDGDVGGRERTPGQEESR